MHSFLSSSSTSVSVIKFTTIRPYRDLSIKPHFLTHVHVNLMFAAADIAVSSPVFLSALLYSCQLSCIPVSSPVFLSAILFSCQLSCFPVSSPVFRPVNSTVFRPVNSTVFQI